MISPAPIDEQPQPGLEVMPPAPEIDPSVQAEQDAREQEIQRAAVRQWQARIDEDKKKWEPDFIRMRKNMEFVASLQWDGQTQMDDPKYISNLVLQAISHKVATLYAKDPRATFKARKKLNFTIWDGEIESIEQAMQQAQGILQTGQPLPPEMSSFFQDIEQGRLKEALINKVGRTAEVLYDYTIDSQKPEFKEQIKQCVCRTITCCVSYGRLFFCSADPSYTNLTSIDYGSTAQDRANRAKEIVRQLEEGEIERESASAETLKSLALSLGATQEEEELPERIEFDFPPATSVIPDKRCRSLKEWVGARWLTIEYLLPLDDVNAIFGTEVKIAGSGAGDGAKEYGSDSQASQVPTPISTNPADLKQPSTVCVWEVFDKTTKTRFFICDGWKDYLLPPESPDPMLKGFWPLFSLVFNRIEVAGEGKLSIYPPSDVQLMKAPQKEWNRTREDLRDQRRANAPVWMYREGMVSKEDLEKVVSAGPNECIGLKSVSPEQKLEDIFARRPIAEIDPAVYDTGPMEKDIMLAVGMQQANLGPAQANVTATVGSIAEQSRQSVSASNVDDLDGFLQQMAQAFLEIAMQKFSIQTVKRIAGPGAVWPSSPQTRLDFLNEISLKIEAASSGRPNKAMDIANWRDLAPVIAQAGGNPIGIVEETARRLDDQLDPSKFFPLNMGMGAGQGQPQQGGPQPTPGNNPAEGPQRPPAAPAAGGNDQNARYQGPDQPPPQNAA
jgi:hypothetical protein